MSEIYKRTGMCGSFTAGNIGEKAVINGWVAKRRNLGGLVFCDIRDKTGIVQVVFDENVPKALFEKADSLRSEYVVGVKGTVRRRESVNPDIPTGDVEILAEDMVVYATSETPPIYVKDDDKVDDNLRLKYRYLDLRKPSMQQNLTFRHKVTKLTRDFFDAQGFTEGGDADADQAHAGRSTGLSGAQQGQPRQLLCAAAVAADVQAAPDGGRH